MFDSDKMMKIRGSQGGEDGWALHACDTCGQNARHERCGGGYVWTCGACGGGPLSVASSEEAAAASATSTPVVDRLLVEAAVEAKWRGGERWWPGRVAFVHEDGAFDVKYDDGEEEERVPAYFVRPLARAGGRLTSGTFVIVYWNNEDGGGEWYPGTIKGKCPHSSKFQISYVDGEFAADYLTGSSGVAYRFIDQLPAAEDDDDARSEDEGAALAEEQRTVVLPPLPPPPALPAAAPRPLLAAAEAELHGGTAGEEQAAPRFYLPQFLGRKDVAGARATSVQYFDQAWASTHDGEPCPPARYAGWSVVLTGSASEPTNFVDAAGVVYRRRKDAARAMGILAGPLSERATSQYSKYAKTPFGDQRALLLEPPPQAASPSPPLPSPPPSSHVQTQKRESGMDVIDGLEIVAEEAPSHARQSSALADAHASTVAELEETIATHAATIAARDETIAARDETIARLKRQLRDYEQPAAPARPAVSRPAAQGRFLPAKPGKQPRDDAARRPPPPPSLPKARLGERGGRTASAHTPLFLRPRRTVEGARAAMMMVVDGLYGASHGGARCPPDLYAGWSVVLTRMGTEPLRWVDGGGRVWRTRNDATRAMGLVRDLGPPKCRATDQHWAKMPFGDRRGLLREGTPEPEVVDLASDDERAAPRKKPRRE